MTRIAWAPHTTGARRRLRRAQRPMCLVTAAPRRQMRRNPTRSSAPPTSLSFRMQRTPPHPGRSFRMRTPSHCTRSMARSSITGHNSIGGVVGLPRRAWPSRGGGRRTTPSTANPAARQAEDPVRDPAERRPSSRSDMCIGHRVAISRSGSRDPVLQMSWG